MRPRVLLLTLAIAGILPSIAQAADTATPASGPVSFEWNLRLRYEHVEDDAFVQDANATTLRLRAGVRFKLDNGFNALVEGEGIADAGDGYNSGANGRTTRPTITDPEGAELNQAWVGWKNKTVGVTVGRQRLLFDNQRWIGNSGWRQNEQTFDAISADWKIASDWSARYAYLGRVHRVAGDNALDPKARQRNLDSHLAELAWKHGIEQVSGYAWLHEDQDVPSASTETFGVRALTDLVRDGNGFGLALELARQRDYANNPLAFSHSYWLVEPAWTVQGTTLRAGWEHLGGNGTHALQTPLATLHAFDGWADKFLVTPAAGLEDRYVGAGGKVGAAKQYDWQVAWHDYRADTGSVHYGREWNGSFGFPVARGVRGLVKLANYQADAFARDTFKAWMQLEWAH